MLWIASRGTSVSSGTTKHPTAATTASTSSVPGTATSRAPRGVLWGWGARVLACAARVALGVIARARPTVTGSAPSRPPAGCGLSPLSVARRSLAARGFSTSTHESSAAATLSATASSCSHQAPPTAPSRWMSG